MSREYKIVKPIFIGDIVRADDGTSWHVFEIMDKGVVRENSEIKRVGQGLASADPTVYLAEVAQADADEESADAFALTKVEEQHITENSLERMINSTKTLLAFLAVNLPGDHKHAELVGINLQDWEDLGQLAYKLWDAKRDEIFRDRK